MLTQTVSSTTTHTRPLSTRDQVEDLVWNYSDISTMISHDHFLKRLWSELQLLALQYVEVFCKHEKAITMGVVENDRGLPSLSVQLENCKGYAVNQVSALALALESRGYQASWIDAIRRDELAQAEFAMKVASEFLLRRLNS